MRIARLVVMGAACAAAQGLETPRLGMMLDRGGALRPVLGIAASVTLGEATVHDARAFDCTGQRCLVKTAAKVGDGSSWTDAPAGPAVFGGDLMFFAETKQVARWRSGVLEAVAVTIDEEVLSLREAEDGAVDFALRREAGITIVRVRIGDGRSELLDEFRDASGPVLLLSDGVVFATSDEMVLRRADGTELRFKVAAATRMLALGEALIQIVTGDGIFALRVQRGRELLFQLPEVER